jgi:hypothetical protein
MFAGADSAGERAAVTIVETAKLNGLDRRRISAASLRIAAI